MNPIRRSFRRVFALALATGALAALPCPPAAAQADNPHAGKPLRMILPVGAGSGVDTIMRAAGPAIGKALGQTVVIENLPGAGGIIGTSAIVKAAPDGLTIGVVSNNHVVNPSVYKSLPYDAVKDITPISVVGQTPFVLVVNPSVPATSAKELVAYLKAKPDAYNYGSSGNGTIIHLAGAMFVDAAKVEVKHIPYKGVGPQLTDLMGGQVQLGVVAVPAVLGQLRANQLRPIGIMGKDRAPALPDVPTFIEQGMPEVDVAGWFAVVAPAGLPAADVKRIHDAVVQAFASPDVAATMAKQNNIIRPTSPEEATKMFESEIERYAGLVKRAGIKID